MTQSKRGIRSYAAHGADATPHIGVVGGIHGNEHCGPQAMAQVERALQQGELKLERGRVTFVDANPEALAFNLRHTEKGDDLNRLWEFDFEKRLAPEAWGYEHHRVLELREAVADFDILLDVHSASEPTPPFAICIDPGASLKIAKQLGTAYVVQQWDSLEDKVMIGYLAKRGTPSVVVECGLHFDPAIAEAAEETIYRFMHATGVLKQLPQGIRKYAAPPTVVHVVEAIQKRSAAFELERAFHGFERIAAGTVVCRDQLSEVRAHRDCYAVLPHPHVRVGGDILYLAKEVAEPNTTAR